MQCKTQSQLGMQTCSFSLNSNKMWWFFICWSAWEVYLPSKTEGDSTFDAVARTPKVMEWDWRAGEGGEVQNPLDLGAKIPLSLEIGWGSANVPSGFAVWLLLWAMVTCSHRGCSFTRGSQRPDFFLHPAPSGLSASGRQHFTFCSKRKNNFQMLLAHFFRYSGSSVKALHELMCRMCRSHCVASYDL